MKKTGILKAMKLCKDSEKMSAEKKQKLREERLNEIVKHARENSPYYKKLYQDVPEDFKLSDLPPVDKRTLMENWNDWVCDRNLTLADVEKDYYKVFSRKYPNLLNELFIAGDGAVYALNASRGADIFYEKSTITEITSRTDEEIFFTVENHYSGTDRDPDMPETRTDTFSVVIENDGSWHAGKFNLPY